MRKYFFLFLLASVCGSAYAQKIYNSTGRRGAPKLRNNVETKGFDPEKVIFGGNFGLGYGSSLYSGSIFSASIRPELGYKLTNWFAAGINFGYQYVSQQDALAVYNYSSGNYDYKNLNQSIIAPGAWIRVKPFANIFAQASFEYNLIKVKGYSSDPINGTQKDIQKYGVPSLLLGIGYQQPVTDRISFVTTVMYDVLQNIPANTRKDQNNIQYSISPYARTLELRFGILVNY